MMMNKNNKNILLIMPENPHIPYGGLGIKWKQIIQYLSPEYNFYIIGDNHGNFEQSVFKTDEYEFYQIQDNVDELINPFIENINLIINFDLLFFKQAEYISKKYKIPMGQCFDAPYNHFLKDYKFNNELIYYYNDHDALFNILCSQYKPYFNCFSMSAKKTFIIHNGIDINDFSDLSPIQLPGENKKKLLYIGRIETEKNIDALLLSCLPDDVDLILVGKDTQTIQLITQMLKWKRNTYHIGYVNGKERLNYINSCDAVIIPSLTEPFGIVALEALMCKKPLICSGVDGLRSWLKSEYYINCGTTSYTIEKTIFDFFSGKIVYNNIDKAYNFAKNFTVERMAKAYREVIKKYL